MKARDVFVKHDERREQWRVQPMGWIAAALVAIFVASSTSGVWRSLAGPRLRVTPTVPSTAIPTGLPNPTSRPTATSVVRSGCPDDPALWTLVPYTLPGAEEAVLYKVDPPCVMEQVERAFAACTDRKGEQGRHWTAEDEGQCYSTAGYTTIIGGEDILALAPGWPAYGRCVETEKEDGTPVTSADLYFVFYTISQDRRMVVDMLVINDTHPYVRVYDCETGELVEEVTGDPTQTVVAYHPLSYEDGRWRRGYRHDVWRLVPADEIDPAGMIGLVRSAQGR